MWLEKLLQSHFYILKVTQIQVQLPLIWKLKTASFFQIFSILFYLDKMYFILSTKDIDSLVYTY